MDFQILPNVAFSLHGFSGVASPGNSTETAFQLMNKMWQIVKSNNLPNKGMNVWVYEPGNAIFAGVELIGTVDDGYGLERKAILIQKCAFCRHIGPYNLIPRTSNLLRDELKKRELSPGAPYVEVYGHWTKDEAALQTDLYLALQ